MNHAFGPYMTVTNNKSERHMNEMLFKEMLIYEMDASLFLYASEDEQRRVNLLRETRNSWHYTSFLVLSPYRMSLYRSTYYIINNLLSVSFIYHQNILLSYFFLVTLHHILLVWVYYLFTFTISPISFNLLALWSLPFSLLTLHYITLSHQQRVNNRQGRHGNNKKDPRVINRLGKSFLTVM